MDLLSSKCVYLPVIEVYYSDARHHKLCVQGRPGLLYKLHSSVLGFLSQFFKTLFSLPRGPNTDHNDHFLCIDLLNLLKDTKIDDLCEGCRKRTVFWVWGTGHATKEDDLIDAAATALMALQTDEPIRAALRNSVLDVTPSNGASQAGDDV
ncbi:hypothetical protein B0H17DRAFT_1135497 [Mycena rosella]|uniref:BTB domain-containing protein n=1 Tax=Mycena rosella TaxID=1033263 RepID=A0AAD7GCX9_MYCRO|nr:hypothetical protein B0H17DRAFT_1135497 [Mycena rosella]